MADVSKKILTGRQWKALASLLTTSTITAAAKACAIPERTLYRFLKDPNFADAYRDARCAQVHAAIAQLQRVATKAAMTLETLLGDPLTKGSTKVSACKVVLDAALRATELESIERRLSALEKQAQEQHEPFA